ncbi:MAG TPA: molybdopterin-dependent oxidoreductase [Chloroflexota bacterium]|nr:molybdopterin-dependent oxidoreductase [Chloroflexota bacterium]
MNRRPRGRSLLYGALLGGLTSLPVIALFYLGKQVVGAPFVPYDFFEWISRVLPGGVVAGAIDSMVAVIQALHLGQIDQAAKLIEQLMAIAINVAIGALFGILIVWGRDATPWSASSIGFFGSMALFLMAIVMEVSLGNVSNPELTLLWTTLLIVGWGAALGYILDAVIAQEGAGRLAPEYQPERRRALMNILGGSFALALAGSGLGWLLQEGRRDSGAGVPLKGPVPPAPTIEPNRIEPAPGTRSEITPNRDFYRIDIDLRPPVVDGNSWMLAVDGLFERSRNLTLSDLMAYPAVTQPITLSCISNPIGGELIGTGYWTGVRLATLLQDLGLRPEARALRIEATDGFYESVVMANVDDPRTLLVYGMNGETLPVEHGFPLRIYIPNRYGMKQPKWITRMQAMEQEQDGYWVERGWSKEARPQIVSVIDTVAANSAVDGKIPIGGIAWAGDRGIQQVELQVDGGEWQPATLRVPPVGPLTWVQWRYDWPGVAGRHTFRVRATDGTGALQIEKEMGTFPDGATGYHSVAKDI